MFIITSTDENTQNCKQKNVPTNYPIVRTNSAGRTISVYI